MSQYLELLWYVTIWASLGEKTLSVSRSAAMIFQLMSNNQRYAQFLFHLSDLGCSLQVSKLRDTARTVLKLMPADAHTIEKFRHVCVEHVRTGATGVSHLLDAMFFNSSPTQVLYNIEVRGRC